MVAELVADNVLLPFRRAQNDPEGPCIADERRRLSNGVFASAVDAMAARLAARGVGFGDTVATLLPNCVELVVTMFATWRLGAVLTPVDPALPLDAAVHQLEDAGAQFLVASGADHTVAALAGACLIERSVVLVPAGSAQLRPVSTAPADFALALYSPRGAGTALGVLLDHGSLSSAAEASIERLGLRDTDRSLLLLPLSTAAGLTLGALATLAAGGDVVLVDLSQSPDVVKVTADHGVTFFCADVRLYRRLASAHARVDPGTLRLVACADGTLDDELRQRLEDRLGVVVLEGWGLAETAGAVTLNPPGGHRRAGTAGLALQGSEVHVLGPQDQTLASGEVGEVVVRGRSVMRGYLGRPSVTADLLHHGWLRTGVAGYLEPDGHLVLMGLLDEAVLRGEQHVYPREVEAALCAHDDVLDARVTGRPDPCLGQVAVAEVVLRPGRSIPVSDLMTYCRRTLDRYKVPESVRIVAGVSGGVSRTAARST